MIMELILKTENNEIEFYYKNQTSNKRGQTINYLTKTFCGKSYIEVLNTALNKTDSKYLQLCKAEWDTLKNPDLSVEELVEFYKTHPFWKKETFTLLHNYWQLYSGFTKACRRAESTDSKNIISTNNMTCITSLHRVGNKLYVYQRSCDISLGLFADAITIKFIMDELNVKDVLWTIAVPHIYVNNYEQTVKYFADYEMKRPKMTFNVRKENKNES